MSIRSLLFESRPNLNLPEVDYEPSSLINLKKAMIAEGTLIANNLKVFFSVMGVTGLTAADLVANPQSFEDWSLKGLLLMAVLVLSRVVVVQQRNHEASMKELLGKYEQALKDDRDDDDDRHGRSARGKRG